MRRQNPQHVLAILPICWLLVVVAPSTSQGVAPSVESSYNGSILIGAFNIQIFGITKVGRSHVVDVLVEILQRYDLLFVQEIRDRSMTAIETLLNTLNSDVADRYAMVVSPRLGRTSSKEQYAYIYKPSRLKLLWHDVYDDVTHDHFEREPFVAYFEAPTTAVDKFGMIGVHIKPSDAVQELDHLVRVYEDYKNRSGNENAIIAGDLNADCRYVSQRSLRRLQLRTDERFQWIITDEMDTTVAASDCTYDRLIVVGGALLNNTEPTKTAVFYFDAAYNLTMETTREVSDHYPVEMVLRGNLSSAQPTSAATRNMLAQYAKDAVTSNCGRLRSVAWVCVAGHALLVNRLMFIA